MSRRGTSGLEYVYLIAIAAAAIIAMSVYMRRGFQGNVRSLSEQVGAGQYAPGNTTVDNVETKHSVSKVTSTSVSTTTYSNGSGPNQSSAVSENKDESTDTVSRQTNEKLGSLSDDE